MRTVVTDFFGEVTGSCLGVAIVFTAGRNLTSGTLLHFHLFVKGEMMGWQLSFRNAFSSHISVMEVDFYVIRLGFKLSACFVIVSLFIKETKQDFYFLHISDIFIGFGKGILYLVIKVVLIQ